VLNAHTKYTVANAETIRSAVEHKGLSVVVLVRECVETAKKKRKEVAHEEALV
jgi:TPP-dependent indolepyruvate ferredoxin oxidoreductase alpha subunit